MSDSDRSYTLEDLDDPDFDPFFGEDPLEMDQYMNIYGRRLRSHTISQRDRINRLIKFLDLLDGQPPQFGDLKRHAETLGISYGTLKGYWKVIKAWDICPTCGRMTVPKLRGSGVFERVAYKSNGTQKHWRHTIRWRKRRELKETAQKALTSGEDIATL